MGNLLPSPFNHFDSGFVSQHEGIQLEGNHHLLVRAPEHHHLFTHAPAYDDGRTAATCAQMYAESADPVGLKAPASPPAALK